MATLDTPHATRKIRTIVGIVLLAIVLDIGYSLLVPILVVTADYETSSAGLFITLILLIGSISLVAGFTVLDQIRRDERKIYSLLGVTWSTALIFVSLPLIVFVSPTAVLYMLVGFVLVPSGLWARSLAEYRREERDAYAA